MNPNPHLPTLPVLARMLSGHVAGAALLCAALALSPPAWAGAAPDNANAALHPLGDPAMQPVADERLDGVRGGFAAGAGLRITFGIERASYVNGQLVATTRLNVAAVPGRITGELTQNGRPVDSAAGWALIRNGAGNTFRPGTGADGAIGTVIQNTLNNQHIRNVTQITATVNSLQWLRGQGVQDSVRGALIDSLRR
jgi:hypothetical protein